MSFDPAFGRKITSPFCETAPASIVSRLDGHRQPRLDRRRAVDDRQTVGPQVRLVDLPADHHLAVVDGPGRDLQHGRLGIDQHPQTRRVDGFGPHSAGTVGGADGEPILAVAAGAKSELLFRRRLLAIQTPVAAAIGRDEQPGLDRLPRRIAARLDAEGNRKLRMPRGDHVRVSHGRRRRGASGWSERRAASHLRNGRNSQEPMGER